MFDRWVSCYVSYSERSGMGAGVQNVTVGKVCHASCYMSVTTARRVPIKPDLTGSQIRYLQLGIRHLNTKIWDLTFQIRHLTAGAGGRMSYWQVEIFAFRKTAEGGDCYDAAGYL